MGEFFFMAVAVTAILVITKSVKIVPQADIYVIERLGKYLTSLRGGFHIIIPFIDRIAGIVSTKEEMIQIKRQPVITKDNVTVQIDGIIFAVATDAEKAIYQVSDYHLAVANLSITTIRGQVGAMNLDEILSNRADINSNVLSSLDVAGANWGIKVTRVEISDISVPVAIEEAMSMQMKAEREKRAIELEAQAKKEATIRQAEAYKQEQVLKAEAQERTADADAYTQTKIAEAQKLSMEMINQALDENRHAAEFMLAKDRVAAFNELAKNPSKDKVIIPYEVSAMIGSVSVVGDLLGEAFSTKKQG